MKYVGPTGSTPETLWILRPNYINTFEWPILPENYTLKPGKYNVYFEETEKGGGEFPSTKIKTKPISFEIIKKPAVKKEKKPELGR